MTRAAPFGRLTEAAWWGARYTPSLFSPSLSLYLSLCQRREVALGKLDRGKEVSLFALSAEKCVCSYVRPNMGLCVSTQAHEAERVYKGGRSICVMKRERKNSGTGSWKTRDTVQCPRSRETGAGRERERGSTMETKRCRGKNTPGWVRGEKGNGESGRLD